MEKIIYFRHLDRIDDFMSCDIMVDHIDGPFKNTYNIGVTSMLFNDQLKSAIIDSIEINDEFKELNILSDIIDIWLSLAKCMGYRSTYVKVDNIDDEYLRILRNMGFSESDDASLFYKNTKNLL